MAVYLIIDKVELSMATQICLHSLQLNPLLGGHYHSSEKKKVVIIVAHACLSIFVVGIFCLASYVIPFIDLLQLKESVSIL